MKIAELSSLNLVLTAQCNLRCGYCYQNAKKPLRMTWDTLRAGLDLALGSTRHEVAVHFIGGEPLLEFPMMRRSVEYLEERRPVGKRFKYGLSTNGTLLTDSICAFLDDHGFETQISFDGIPEVQDCRGAGTFDVLDRLLDRLRGRHPSFYRWLVRIAVTVNPSTLPYLADSVEYFLKKGVSKILMMPSIIIDSQWDLERIGEIDGQFDRIYRSSLRHWQAGLGVPLAVFQNKYDGPCGAEHVDSMCGVAHGGALVVDVDGRACGCTVHASSYQEIRSPFLRRCLDCMQMGSINDDGFAARCEAFPEAARSTGLFHNKRRKRSAYARCGECKYLGDCTVCPTSIGHIPGNSDPDRVPDFFCAYNLVSLKYRERFPSQRRPQELLRGPVGLVAEMERWRTLADAAHCRADGIRRKGGVSETTTGC